MQKSGKKDEKDRFVKIHCEQFRDLFIHPAFKGVKQQVLAWVVRYTWGEADWDKAVDGKPPNRKFTEKPIRACIIAKDIRAHRKRVSAAIVELRNLGVLIQDKNGGEGINKKTLAKLPKWTKSETGKTSTKTGTVNKNGDARPQKGGRFEGNVNKNGDVGSCNAAPDNELQSLQTSSDLQTKYSRPKTAGLKKTPERPDFDAVEAKLAEIHPDGATPSAKTVQGILNECRAADLHPVVLLDYKPGGNPIRDPYPYVRNACKLESREKYRDRVGSYWNFLEEFGDSDDAGVDALAGQIAEAASV